MPDTACLDVLARVGPSRVRFGLNKCRDEGWHVPIRDTGINTA